MKKKEISANKSEKKEISSNKNEKEKGITKDIDNYDITTIGEIKCQKIPFNDISKFKNIEIDLGSFEKVGGEL